VKAFIDTDGSILGCHTAGPEASNLIEDVVVAMTSGTGTVHDIRDAVHVHPALSEVVQRAFSGRFTCGGNHGHEH
jgi:mycothione reductase